MILLDILDPLKTTYRTKTMGMISKDSMKKTFPRYNFLLFLKKKSKKFINK